MNIGEFQEENNIVDPNVRRRQQQQPGTQEISKPASSEPTKKRIVTPQEMGFTHEQPVKVRPEQPILDNMEKAIARKRREAQLLSDAIEESDGEGVSEEEFQDLLDQAKNEIYADDMIPAEKEEPAKKPVEKTKVTAFPKDNPTVDLMDELDAEIEKDEEDYANENPNGREEDYEDDVVEERKIAKVEPSVDEDKPTVKASTPVVNDDPFANFESGDINFDEENEELDENIDEQKLADKEQQDQVEKLRTLVREKIRPVTNSFDISTFSISKRPAASTISTPRDNGQKIADWVLMSSQKPIYMRRFTGTEIERLSNGGKGRTRLNRALDTWQLIYNHIVDPHKPETLEEWAKTTSFLDIDHIYMAIYRANFEGSNYIPYSCTNKACKEKVFLSDNFDIMDMCKFAKKEDKEKFLSIIGSETDSTSKLYSTEIVPVSDDYAFAFREPSIYNIIFESAVLDEDFVDKFGDLITISTYIDQIYYINKEARELQPVRTNIYPNNMKKTVKSRIINYSKIISTLGSDQYNTLLAYMQKINSFGDSLTYQLPEVTCPCCGTVIPATDQEAQNLVFTRHQLAALATL